METLIFIILIIFISIIFSIFVNKQEIRERMKEEHITEIKNFYNIDEWGSYNDG